MKMIRLLSLALVVTLGSSVFGHAEKNTASLPAALKGVALAEIPAQAAALIAAAKPATREATATDVVSGTVKAYPAIASAIVGAVCTQFPELAAAVAKAAVSVQPKQAQLIARAAAAAAPAFTADIKSALVALGEATPALKASLTPVIASLQSPAPLIASAASVTPTPSLPEAPVTVGRGRGPIVSGPYVPLSGTPTNTPPGTPVPPTGDYARP